MICSGCGALLDDDSLFCASCGKPVHSPELNPANEDLLKMHSNEGDGDRQDDQRTDEVEAGKIEKDVSASAMKDGMSAHGLKMEKPVKNDTDGEKQESKSKKMSIREKAGLAAGTFFIVLGLIRVLTAGTSISSTSFGGDFYTYTYQGIVAVAESLAVIEVTLGWILAAIGTAIDIMILI